MAADRSEVLLIGPTRPVIARGLAGFNLHKLGAAPNRDAFLASVAGTRALAVSSPVMPIDDALFSRLPKLEIVSSFGVGYDHVDAIAAAKRASWSPVPPTYLPRR
jgi:lactate dehydrogenase-like 2-hydroxyacid dehydrogenase